MRTTAAGSWVYTVGLLDAAAHPELIVAGLSVNEGASLLSMLARSVLGGERYQVGETIDSGRGIAHVGAVHEIQYELGTFNIWDQLRTIGVLRERELAAVQIVLPPELLPRGRTCRSRCSRGERRRASSCRSDRPVAACRACTSPRRFPTEDPSRVG